MNAITIQQYLHRPNATELGQGNTNECYMLISTEIDISNIFPVGVDISVQDTQSKKVYKLKAAKIREYRVNQFGDLYRDYDVHPGDEILITKISKEAIEKVYVTVNKFNRVCINVTGNGAEIFNIDRMRNFKTSNEKYSLPVSYSDVNGNLAVTYDGQKKKRQDSPVLTDFYSAVFNGQRLQNRLYFLNIATHNELLTLPKSEYNRVIVDSTFNIDKFLDKCNSRTQCSQYQSISDLLILKRNLVLTGAPGTGKTFIAKAVAADIISDGTKDWDTLVKEDCPQIGFVQFHPSYDYTDFVEGLRPGENGEFRRQDGIFKEFCKRALGEEDVVSEVSTNIFDRVYNELLDDIRGGVITSYERITADDRGLAVNGKNKIIFGPEVTNYKTASIRNLRLLFDYYQAKGIKDASSLTRDDLWGAISTLTGGKTKTLDYTEYRWALNQLLSRATKADKSLVETAPIVQKEDITKKPFVFIIDEINRGELSKIFGELFYSIEPDYRGPKGTVQTQYNNMVEDDDIFKSGFYVPENVYIIGTMNDVDRGVEAMDFAIRRRFGWKEVTDEESAENMGITGLARAKMIALNNALIENGLTRAHCIGGAYFRKLEGDDFKALWDYHLEGIIFEYFRGEPDATTKIDDIKKAYNDAKLSEKTPEIEESVSTEEGSAK